MMFSFRSLPVRSAAFFWWSNLPVVLGVAVGAAVLTGALIVGDSLRGSLRERAVGRLNGVEAAYVGDRMVRAELADEIGPGVVPATMLRGSVRATKTTGEMRRVNRVSVVGFGPRGQTEFRLPEKVDWSGNSSRVAVLGHTLAEQLGVGVGDDVVLGVEKTSAVPRSSLLGRRAADDVTESLTLTVAAVLAADDPMGGFSLTPSASPAENVFVPLAMLQDRLEQPGRVNALLATTGPTQDLNRQLAARLRLDDWGLSVTAGPHRNAYVSVESNRLVIDPMAVDAIGRAADAIGSRHEDTLVYLANAIGPGPTPVWNDDVGQTDRLIPYSIVAGLNTGAVPPLGPFLPSDPGEMADDEIVLVRWPEMPLGDLVPGSPLTVTYFKPEMEAAVEETSATFRLKGYLPLAGPADDPDLTPPFPGVTDKLRIDDWDAPFPINNRRIQARDEQYWDAHRATPKAYVTSAAAQKLFGSRFGNATSVRVAPVPGSTPADTVGRMETELLRTLSPESAGLAFSPTKDRVLAASRGGTDFGMLFLGFSCFLILSALLIVSLLFRLALDRRASHVGVLLGTGYSPGQVLRLLLAEGLIVAVIGAAVGMAGAVLFAAAMIRVTADLWPTADAARVLELHADPVSFVAGFLGTMAMAVATIWLSVRSLVKVPVPALLRGKAAEDEVNVGGRGGRWSPTIAVVLGLSGVGLLGFGSTQSNPDVRAGSFFGGGLCLLIAGLLLARVWLLGRHRSVESTRGRTALARLGVRYAARNPARSLLTAGLIASATFLLVAVESFRRRPDLDFGEKTGGSGGFPLIAEADVPVFQPFDTQAGKDDLIERLQVAYQQAGTDGKARDERLDRAEALLDTIEVLPFRLESGDDASCLNLYQAGRPRVIGVPDSLIARGGFRFAQTTAETPEERANPWLLLNQAQPDGAVPTFVEQNTAMWMLKTGVGGTWTRPDETGRPVTFRIVGTLQDSVFQSEMLVADGRFRSLFPREEGYRVFLIDAPADDLTDVSGLLETALAANGLTVEASRSRVAAYQAVVGAYLTTFQLLGGFGLLLGVAGVGVVILRSVRERAGEFALLRAVGYTTADLQTVLLAENVLILTIGMGVGVAAAIVSVVPNLALGGLLPGWPLAAMLAGVFVSGLVVSVAATASVARVPLIPALRNG